MKGLLVGIALLGVLQTAAQADENDVEHCKRQVMLGSRGATEPGSYGKIDQQDNIQRALSQCESLSAIRHTPPPADKARDPNDLRLAPDLTLVATQSAGFDSAAKRKMYTCQYRDGADQLHVYTVYDRCPKP